MVTIGQIDTFSRFTQVSRETIISLKKYEKLIIDANNGLNLIGKSTLNHIWTRHFLDSSQVIDFIDKEYRTLVDIGSGAGFPGLVLAILAKDRKINLKIRLIEKSKQKASFLKQVVNDLGLDVDVQNQNILYGPYKLTEDLITARAFKPLGIILQFLNEKAENWKKIFLFMGKTGKKDLLQASKRWNIEYKQRMSITNNDSIVIEINKLKKK
jgi:16S rRNA (guanine527-N7)-methyltransferase